jgi:hypothetical protein
VIVESGLFEDGNLSAIWIQDGVLHDKAWPLAAGKQTTTKNKIKLKIKPYL